LWAGEQFRSLTRGFIGMGGISSGPYLHHEVDSFTESDLEEEALGKGPHSFMRRSDGTIPNGDAKRYGGNSRIVSQIFSITSGRDIMYKRRLHTESKKNNGPPKKEETPHTPPQIG